MDKLFVDTHFVYCSMFVNVRCPVGIATCHGLLAVCDVEHDMLSMGNTNVLRVTPDVRWMGWDERSGDEWITMFSDRVSLFKMRLVI